MSNPTSKLVEIIKKRAGGANSWAEVQQLIAQGADIRVPVRKGSSMIQSVIDEEARLRHTVPFKAENCQRLIKLLQQQACHLLSKLVLSNDGDLDEMDRLVKLQASCYQEEEYGSLGLLGRLLEQHQYPVRLDVVRFLVESDQDAKWGLTKIDDQQRTCLSLLEMNPTFTADVTDYIQQQFNLLLNKISVTHPQLDVNEVAHWIRRGANPETVDENQNTVLSNAVLANNLDLVRVLVANGCNTKHVNSDNKTPLQIAQGATPRNAQLVATLLEQNVNNELQQSIRTKRSRLTQEEIHKVLQKGANINARVNNNDSFLHLLIANNGTPEMVVTFVNDFNADLSLTNNDRHRPIELCILYDEKPFAVLLAFLKLSKVLTDAFFNDLSKKSIHQFATEQGRHESAHIIQKELNRRLWVCISRASNNDDHNQSILAEVEKLVDYGAQIDHLQNDDNHYKGWSVLHVACKTATQSFVKYLVRNLKANCALKNSVHDRPISIAAEYGQLHIVQFLLGCQGVQLNVSNRNLETPLHLAAKNHHFQVVRYLILWGANHEVQNLSKQSPLALAQKNSAKTNEDEIKKEQIIKLFQNLEFATHNNIKEEDISPTISEVDLDTCELVTHIHVNEIQRYAREHDTKTGDKRLTFFNREPTSKLHNAAKNGNILTARQAINDGADICHCQNRRTPYEVAKASLKDYTEKAKSTSINDNDRRQFCTKAQGCQQIADDLFQIAQIQLVESIKQSNFGRVVAYHKTGVSITPELLYLACTSSDNVEIVDYLIHQSHPIYEAMYNYTTPDSPYHLAKKNQLKNVANYIRYRLSIDCTEAIKKSDVDLVKKLIHAGASVDMDDTNNLVKVLPSENIELIQILCENGAKMPTEWLQSNTIVLPSSISEPMNPDIAFTINRNLLDRRLRVAAASGNLTMLVQCQHLGADINSQNCYGSTALLCAIQHGNYFQIVHSLVSRGATMLHSNKNQSMSLIKLCEKSKYKDIAKYLKQQLNVQFFVAIIDNDKQTAAALEALGVDFKCRDEQNRTPLHYAVQYHGIDLVTWLCDRGSTPTVADNNGDYPITQAAEKGDFAIIEFFATKYPITKTQKNKAGATALQIAKKEGFKRIAQILEFGKVSDDSSIKDKTKTDTPKHSYQTLVAACQNGQAKTIKEFCQERYESREKKKQLCCELIQAAKDYKQEEIVDILQFHYDHHLTKDLPSDIQMDNIVTLNSHYRKMLGGFLVGLNGIIAGSDVALDPTDPNTFIQLFSHLTSNVRKRSQDVGNANNNEDIQRLIQKEFADSDEKLVKINDQLDQLEKNNQALMKCIQETNERLSNDQKPSALQRKQLLEEREIHKKQLATYECSMLLFQREQESLLNRRKTIDFIKQNSNLFLFYRTVENRLQALFHSVLAAQGGYLQSKTTLKFPLQVAGGLAPSVLSFALEKGRDSINLLSKFLPAGDLLKPIKTVTDTIVSKLNEKEQKKEFYNISTLGNIEELQRAASDTAGLLTLYYRQQIECIDTSKKIKGSNVFNDQIHWINEVFINVRPESNEERGVIIVAEYVIAWIMEALKKAKESGIVRTIPLSQQLWLCAARVDPIEQGMFTKATDILGTSSGRQLIPLKIKDRNDKLFQVQLRHFIGCVSVIINDGSIYQYRVSSKNSQEINVPDLEVFGYVYVAAFTSDSKTYESIITGRQLVLANRNASGDILTKFEDIIQLTQTFHSDGIITQSAIMSETAFEVAKVLRQQKSFVSLDDVDAELEKSQNKMMCEIEALGEDIQGKTAQFQTSIDAAHERTKLELAQAQAVLSKDNQKQLNDAMRKLTEQMQETQKHFDSQVDHSLNDIRKQTRAEVDRMKNMVEMAKTEFQQTTQVDRHAQNLKFKAKKSRTNAEATAHKNEIDRQQYRKQATAQIDTRTGQNIHVEYIQPITGQLTKRAHVSLTATEPPRRNTQKIIVDRIDTQGLEIKMLHAKIKWTEQQPEQALQESREALLEAKRTQAATVSILQNVNAMCEEMKKSPEDVRKFRYTIDDGRFDEEIYF